MFVHFRDNITSPRTYFRYNNFKSGNWQEWKC